MGGFDAPRFRVEVIGAVADVLYRSQRLSLVGDGDDASWGIWWQHECLASEILQRLCIWQVCRGKFAFWQIGFQHFELRVKGVSILSMLFFPLSTFAQHAKEQAFATGDARDEAIDGGIEALKE